MFPEYKYTSWSRWVGVLTLWYEVISSAKSLQSCDPMDCSPPGSSVHEIFQARKLEWVAISFSRGSSPPMWLNPGSSALQADSLPSEPPGKHCYVSSTKSKCYEEREDVQFIFISLPYLAQSTILSRWPKVWSLASYVIFFFPSKAFLF